MYKLACAASPFWLINTMPQITGDMALTVVPFFAPLLIAVCFMMFVFAHHLNQHERRIEFLEGHRIRQHTATAPRLMPFPLMRNASNRR